MWGREGREGGEDGERGQRDRGAEKGKKRDTEREMCFISIVYTTKCNGWHGHYTLGQGHTHTPHPSLT